MVYVLNILTHNSTYNTLLTPHISKTNIEANTSELPHHKAVIEEAVVEEAVAEGKQGGHAPSKIHPLQQFSFLSQLTFVEITRLSQR